MAYLPRCQPAQIQMPIWQPRRKKLKGLGGEISLPTPETNEGLKQKLKLKIQQGEFTVGELIVPREVRMASLLTDLGF